MNPAPLTSTPTAAPAQAQRLMERIAGRRRVALGDAMRLRDLGIPPFIAASVFVLDDRDGVAFVGGTEVTHPVEVDAVLAELQRRA